MAAVSRHNNTILRIVLSGGFRRTRAALFSGGTCAANTPPHNTLYCGGVRITPQRRPRRRRAAATIRHKRIVPNRRLGPPLAYWPVARPTGQYRRRGLVSATKWWPPSGSEAAPWWPHTSCGEKHTAETETAAAKLRFALRFDGFRRVASRHMWRKQRRELPPSI